MKSNTAVDHPKHYNSHPSGVEAIEICQHLNFALGNAVKYLWRVGLKGEQLSLNPNEVIVQDLQKSAWYLRHALDSLRYGVRQPKTYMIVPALNKVLNNEPEDSVLKAVLEFIPQRIFACEDPRIADALARVEHEITRHQKGGQ